MNLSEWVERMCDAAPDRDVVHRELVRMLSELAKDVCSSCRVGFKVYQDGESVHYHMEDGGKHFCKANAIWVTVKG